MVLLTDRQKSGIAIAVGGPLLVLAAYLWSGHAGASTNSALPALTSTNGPESSTAMIPTVVASPAVTVPAPVLHAQFTGLNTKNPDQNAYNPTVHAGIGDTVRFNVFIKNEGQAPADNVTAQVLGFSKVGAAYITAASKDPALTARLFTSSAGASVNGETTVNVVLPSAGYLQFDALNVYWRNDANPSKAVAEAVSNVAMAPLFDASAAGGLDLSQLSVNGVVNGPLPHQGTPGIGEFGCITEVVFSAKVIGAPQPVAQVIGQAASALSTSSAPNGGMVRSNAEIPPSTATTPGTSAGPYLDTTFGCENGSSKGIFVPEIVAQAGGTVTCNALVQNRGKAAAANLTIYVHGLQKVGNRLYRTPIEDAAQLYIDLVSASPNFTGGGNLDATVHLPANSYLQYIPGSGQMFWRNNVDPVHPVAWVDTLDEFIDPDKNGLDMSQVNGAGSLPNAGTPNIGTYGCTAEFAFQLRVVPASSG